MVTFEYKRAVFTKLKYMVTSDERSEACTQAIEVKINVLENAENPGSVMINVNLLTTGRLFSSLHRGKIIIECFRKFMEN